MPLEYGLEELGVKTKDIFWDDNISDRLIEDERQAEWAQQREDYGFDEREMWSFDVRLAQFIYPRILWYKEYVPYSFMEASLTEKQWNKILHIILYSFGEYATYFKNKPAYDITLSYSETRRRNKIYQRKLKDGRIAFAIWYEAFSY